MLSVSIKLPVTPKLEDTCAAPLKTVVPYMLFDPLALKRNLFPLLASVMLSALASAVIVKSWWFVSSKISAGAVFDIFMLPAAVVTPAILTLSKFVCPSTSKSAFKSIAPANVDTPATFTLSKFVCPSTSISPVSYTHLTLPTNREV